MYTQGKWLAWRFSKLHHWKVSLGDNDDYIDCGDNRANAQLIAAAPKMAKFPENLCAEFEDYGKVDDDFYCAAKDILKNIT